MIGTSSMFVKIVLFNAIRIGCRDLSLPDYLYKSISLLCFDNLNNNLCIWFCIAYHYGTSRERCIKLAKELYKEFIDNLYSINEYEGLNINDIKNIKILNKLKLEYLA